MTDDLDELCAVHMDIQTAREKRRKQSRDECESIFKLAGFEIKYVWELYNGYWPDSPHYDNIRRPWWLFLTEIGPIQIGWRKRVIHIEWEACEFRGVVTNDTVTATLTFVHAYSVEKAIEYLKQLRILAQGVKHD